MIDERIGIIGKTHGVSAKRSPNPKNVNKIREMLPLLNVSVIASVSEPEFVVSFATTADACSNFDASI